MNIICAIFGHRERHFSIRGKRSILHKWQCTRCGKPTGKLVERREELQPVSAEEAYPLLMEIERYQGES